MEVKLNKPLEHGGKKIETLTLNLEVMTGLDYDFCAQQATIENSNLPSIDVRLNPAFQAHIAARASDIPVEALRKLGLGDYGAVMATVRDFFLVTA